MTAAESSLSTAARAAFARLDAALAIVVEEVAQLVADLVADSNAVDQVNAAAAERDAMSDAEFNALWDSDPAFAAYGVRSSECCGHCRPAAGRSPDELRPAGGRSPNEHEQDETLDDDAEPSAAGAAAAPAAESAVERGVRGVSLAGGNRRGVRGGRKHRPAARADGPLAD